MSLEYGAEVMERRNTRDTELDAIRSDKLKVCHGESGGIQFEESHVEQSKLTIQAHIEIFVPLESSSCMPPEEMRSSRDATITDSLGGYPLAQVEAMPE